MCFKRVNLHKRGNKISFWPVYHLFFISQSTLLENATNLSNFYFWEIALLVKALKHYWIVLAIWSYFSMVQKNKQLFNCVELKKLN